eukprot:6198059-Pleurochrysis_carterae.AAC.8
MPKVANVLIAAFKDQVAALKVASDYTSSYKPITMQHCKQGALGIVLLRLTFVISSQRHTADHLLAIIAEDYHQLPSELELECLGFVHS